MSIEIIEIASLSGYRIGQIIYNQENRRYSFCYQNISSETEISNESVHDLIRVSKNFLSYRKNSNQPKSTYEIIRSKILTLPVRLLSYKFGFLEHESALIYSSSQYELMEVSICTDKSDGSRKFCLAYFLEDARCMEFVDQRSLEKIAALNEP